MTFKFITTFALLMGIASMCASDSLAQSWSQTSSTFRDQRFSVEVGAKAYDRPGDDLGFPLISDSITNETLFDSTNGSDLGSAGGAEVKFNFLNKHDRELELRTIIADWDEQTEISGANLSSPFFPPPLPPIPGVGIAPGTPDSILYGYTSDYFSIELMARRAIRPGITLMFGPRIVSTKDEVVITGSQDFAGTTLSTIQTTEATNILLGLQGGVEFNYPIADGVYLNGFGRFGGYTNPTEVNIGTVDAAGATTQGTLTKQTGSFLAEIGGRLYVDIFPNRLSGYVGYEATWIDGLALAPAQILSGGVNGVDTANTPFFNAATIGLRWQY